MNSRLLALPPKADMFDVEIDVRCVPKADICKKLWCPGRRALTSYLVHLSEESVEGSPASRLASAASADQSRSAAPVASSVRKRSRIRLATGMGTCKASAALRAKWMSLKPSFALKPGGV